MSPLRPDGGQSGSGRRAADGERIDRRALVSRHDPVIRGTDLRSPLSVGNGELAFTADLTGLQTLYDEQLRAGVPLCTMSRWGWHSSPAGGRLPVFSDIDLTEYERGGRIFRYAAEAKPGNEGIYRWLRENPHRLNLARVALSWRGEEIRAEEISEPVQRLSLYEGIIESRFLVRGKECLVRTACHGEFCALGFEVECGSLGDGSLGISVSFPYGSPSIEASDWNAEDRHATEAYEASPGRISLLRTLDSDRYRAALIAEDGASLRMAGRHRVAIKAGGPSLRFSIRFAPGGETGNGGDARPVRCAEVFASSRERWAAFWEEGAAVDLSGSSDPRARELERRIALSQYLTAAHCSGAFPPQETGLMCNSWYGKFHLEMHPWHGAWFPLWNRASSLRRSLPWYRSILPAARENAALNGFKGARWPKMTSADGRDSPSWIGTLLVWQQPHLLFMLDLLAAAEGSLAIVAEYWDLVSATADFMADFAELDPTSGTYCLEPPLIPVQETHAPMETRNPAFELAYWRHGLLLAAEWARRLGKPAGGWERVGRAMARPLVKDGLYSAHAACPGPFEAHAKDHPSMLMALGLLPGEGIDRSAMERTLRRVLERWDKPSLWGWDFATIAMSCARLGLPGLAVDALLMDSPKNRYLANGHNDQGEGTGLPAYLPGNGSLLLAVALMASGWPGSGEHPGFPGDGTWTVRREGLLPFPR